jgi:hypothetical protein
MALFGILDRWRAPKQVPAQGHSLEGQAAQTSVAEPEPRKRRRRFVEDGPAPTRTAVKPPLTRDNRRDLSEMKHERMREIARYLWRQNPVAKRGIQNLKAFVTSEGFRVRSLATDPKKRERVQKYLDKWWEKNQWDDLFSKRVETLSVEAEWFYWEGLPDAEGIAKLCAILPENVRHVERDPLDAERMHRVTLRQPLEFCVGEARHVKHHLSIIDEQNLDGDVHVLQINTLTGQTRGFSDLLVVSDWLDYLDTLTFTEIERVQFQRNFSWFVKLDTDDQAIIDQKRDELNEQGPPVPGSLKVHGNGEDWDPKSPELHLEDSVAFIKLIMLICFGGLIMPEHYFASGGDVNKATSANMDTPVWAFTRDRKGQLRSFLRRCIVRALRNLIRAGTLAGMTEDDLKFEIVSRDPDRSAYDLIGDMLKKLAEALQLGEQQGYISNVEAARAYRMAASGLGLGDFPGVDEQSLAQAKEMVKQRLELQKQTLQQQYPTKLPEATFVAESESSEDLKKKVLAAEYEQSLVSELENRTESVQLTREAARTHAEAMSRLASQVLLKNSGLEINLDDIEDRLIGISEKFRKDYPAKGFSLMADSAKSFVDKSFQPWGLTVPSGSIFIPRAGREPEELTWQRRVSLEVIRRAPDGIDRSVGGRNRNIRREGEAWAYFSSLDFAAEIRKRATEAKSQGLTMAQFAGSLASDTRLRDSLAAAMGDKIADNAEYFQLKAVRRAEQMALLDYQRENPLAGIARKFLRIKSSSGPCGRCDPHSGKVYLLREGPSLPMHRKCGCTYLPSVGGASSPFGRYDAELFSDEGLPAAFQAVSVFPAVAREVFQAEGAAWTTSGGFLAKQGRLPAPVVPEWDISGLDLSQQLAAIEARGPMPAKIGGTVGLRYEDGGSCLTHFTIPGHRDRPRLYPIALETLRDPDARGFFGRMGQYYYFKRFQKDPTGEASVFMVITKRQDSGESLVTWYEVDQGLQKANNVIKAMEKVRWFR